MELLSVIGLSLLVFTGIILILVAIITTLEKKLVPQGDVEILINHDESKKITTPAGGSLLSTLTSNGILLPSACGGGGTCAMCRLQILDGAGDILPTETGHFNRKEIKDHWRLACQVKVKENLSIKVPDEIFSIQMFETTVISNDNVATFIKELNLQIEEGKDLHFEAGGYIQIYIPPYQLNFKEFDIADEYKEDWDKYNLWKFNAKNDEQIYRAYSMANFPAEKNVVKLNVRIATPPPRRDDIPPGISSSFIFNLKPGDKVMVSGPYGEFFIHETQKEMIYIGGGAGMAPLRSHIFHLLKTENSKRQISYYYGARSKREIFYEEEFRELEEMHPNFKFHVALSEPLPEDNWTGPVGFIHQILHDNYLKDHDDPTDIEFYMCGPPPMINAVNKMLYDIGVEREQISYDDFGS